ncbi:hypothetical protein C8J57DRAFT_1439998 [Mycena rebaudengoi]|nr:hypothetical protein C8J57DRAFT_1439998 [Mycena rebaudengoi]
MAQPTPVSAGPSGARRTASAAEIEMWEDFAENGANFSAGDQSDSAHISLDRLRQDADSFGLWDPEGVARGLGFGGGDLASEILENDEEEDFLAEIMRHAGLDEPDPADIQNGSEQLEQTKTDSEWFPYPSRMIFLLDMLDNLPRLRISNSLMRVFLWILKEARCKDVPSFDRLRQVQKELRPQCGTPSIPCKSVQGNIFINDPKTIIARDWSNPQTRKHIRVYPEIPEDGVIREIWHAQKWRKNMDLDILSPMYDAGSFHYFVNEVARLRNGKFVVPVRWVISKGKVHADQNATIIDSETDLICASDLKDNYLDLQHSNEVPQWSQTSIASGHPSRMPNPKRKIAGGHPIYSSFVDYFGDDVSGNRRKSWNKHLNAYLTHRNLPRSLLQQEFHTHFISTSPNASISEQFVEFKAAVERTHTDPICVEDETGGTTCICIYVNAGPSDNPMQSKISSHIGGKGNYLCRKCEVGSCRTVRLTLFQAGVPRTKEKILEELQKQVRLACTGKAKHVKDSQTDTGVKDVYTQYWIDHLISRFKELKAKHLNRSDDDIKHELIQWTVDNQEKIYSPFLNMKGFDPTKDTPIEILHTILLGIIKYIWHVSHTPWSAEKKQTYSRRLQATETDGLSIHAIRANYIMQYAGSLIGRQLKTIAQTNVFHVCGLVTDVQFMAWKAAGELSALLWFPEIRNLEEYRQDLKIAVANVFDIFATIDPSKIVTKIKYHLLAHIDEDVLEFGPLIGMITEIYDCFNDIAIQLGDQEGLKHRLTGGRWKTMANEWMRAGPGVRHFLEKHPILQKLLGWSENKPLVHGTVKLEPLVRGQKDRILYKLRATTAAHAVNFGMYQADSGWYKCKYAVSKLFLTVAFHRLIIILQTSTIPGCISDILCSVSSTSMFAVVEVFQVLSNRDPVYGMPVLVRRDAEKSFMIIPVKNLQFKFNVQHDCYSAKCEATGTKAQMQERVPSDKVEHFIVHKDLDRYIINTHAFHNAHLLRATLPRDLIAPILLFPDQRSKHDELATTLRTTLDTKGAQRKQSKKRKGPHSDNEDEDVARPRKRARRAEGETMVATRGKRKVTKSKKAQEMANNEEELDSEDGEDSNDSEEEELYLGSDSEYSEGD